MHRTAALRAHWQTETGAPLWAQPQAKRTPSLTSPGSPTQNRRCGTAAIPELPAASARNGVQAPPFPPNTHKIPCKIPASTQCLLQLPATIQASRASRRHRTGPSSSRAPPRKPGRPPTERPQPPRRASPMTAAAASTAAAATTFVHADSVGMSSVSSLCHERRGGFGA